MRFLLRPICWIFGHNRVPDHACVQDVRFTEIEAEKDMLANVHLIFVAHCARCGKHLNVSVWCEDK